MAKAPTEDANIMERDRAIVRVRSICAYLLRGITLPDGFKIEVDGTTNNILVYNQQWGFCVTEKYCLDYSCPEICDAVVDGIDGIESFPFKQATKELLNGQTSGTKFDGESAD